MKHKHGFLGGLMISATLSMIPSAFIAAVISAGQIGFGPGGFFLTWLISSAVLYVVLYVPAFAALFKPELESKNQQTTPVSVDREPLKVGAQKAAGPAESASAPIDAEDHITVADLLDRSPEVAARVAFAGPVAIFQGLRILANAAKWFAEALIISIIATALLGAGRATFFLLLFLLWPVVGVISFWLWGLQDPKRDFPEPPRGPYDWQP